MISSRRFLVTWNERLTDGVRNNITLKDSSSPSTISDVVLINDTCCVPVLKPSEFNY
jgi:hypothetical protein